MPYILLSLLLVGVGGFLLWRRLHQHHTAMEQKICSLESDVRALCGAASEMGDELRHLKAALKGTVSRQDQLEGGINREQPYHHAIALVKKGASVDELMATCGLARGEAELVGNLYGDEQAVSETTH